MTMTLIWVKASNHILTFQIVKISFTMDQCVYKVSIQSYKHLLVLSVGLNTADKVYSHVGL